MMMRFIRIIVILSSAAAATIVSVFSLFIYIAIRDSHDTYPNEAPNISEISQYLSAALIVFVEAPACIGIHAILARNPRKPGLTSYIITFVLASTVIGGALAILSIVGGGVDMQAIGYGRKFDGNLVIEILGNGILYGSISGFVFANLFYFLIRR
jgi:hypothetical protein